MKQHQWVMQNVATNSEGGPYSTGAATGPFSFVLQHIEVFNSLCLHFVDYFPLDFFTEGIFTARFLAPRTRSPSRCSVLALCLLVWWSHWHLFWLALPNKIKKWHKICLQIQFTLVHMIWGAWVEAGLTDGRSQSQRGTELEKLSEVLTDG